MLIYGSLFLIEFRRDFFFFRLFRSWNSVGMPTVRQRWIFYLEVSVGAVPKNTQKEKKARNAKKVAGKVLREERV